MNLAWTLLCVDCCVLTKVGELLTWMLSCAVLSVNIVPWMGDVDVVTCGVCFSMDGGELFTRIQERADTAFTERGG